VEGKNTDGICKDAEKLAEFISFSLYFHFACVARRGMAGAYKAVI